MAVSVWWICVVYAVLSRCSAEPLVVPLKIRRQPLKQLSFLSTGAWRTAAILQPMRNITHAIEYYGMVNVGGQDFSVIFDTGSDQLALPGVGCVSPACHLHRMYDAAVSKSAGNSTNASSVQELVFGQGKIMGLVREERVCLGGGCAQAQFIEALEESDVPFRDAKFDGVLGLSLKLRSNSTRKSSVLQAMVDSGVIPNAIFAVFMAKDLGSESSQISFGIVDSKVAAGPTLWAPLSDQGYWQFSLADIAVGEVNLNICGDATKKPLSVNSSIFTFFGKMCCRTLSEFDHEKRCQYSELLPGWRSHTTSAGVVLATFEDGRVAVKMEDGCVQKVPRVWLSLPSGCRGDGTIQAIVDTGSSLMMAPQPIVDSILTRVGARENCTAQQGESFPTLAFLLPTGQKLVLKPEDYMDTVEEGNERYCWVHLMAAPASAKGPLFVLGMPFLRTYYTTFDADHYRIGFAEPRQPGALTASSVFGAVPPRSAMRKVALRDRRPASS